MVSRAISTWRAEFFLKVADSSKEVSPVPQTSKGREIMHSYILIQGKSTYHKKKFVSSPLMTRSLPVLELLSDGGFLHILNTIRSKGPTSLMAVG